MKKLLALLKKDLLIEGRNKESIVVSVSLSILLATLLTFGIEGALLDRTTVARLFPTLLWFNVVVTGSIAVARLQHFEQSYGGLEGVLLTGVHPALIFCAKALSTFLILLLAQLVSCGAYVLLLNLSLSSATLIALIPITICALLGYCAVATLFAALTGHGKLGAPLLPLILLPCLFPLFFAAISLTSDALTTGTVNIESGWCALLLAADLIYIICGLNLYEYAVAG